jgi:hypothetical protein
LHTRFLHEKVLLALDLAIEPVSASFNDLELGDQVKQALLFTKSPEMRLLDNSSSSSSY